LTQKGIAVAYLPHAPNTLSVSNCEEIAPFLRKGILKVTYPIMLRAHNLTAICELTV
jgi:hypothetical protein